MLCALVYVCVCVCVVVRIVDIFVTSGKSSVTIFSYPKQNDRQFYGDVHLQSDILYVDLDSNKLVIYK